MHLPPAWSMPPCRRGNLASRQTHNPTKKQYNSHPSAAAPRWRKLSQTEERRLGRVPQDLHGAHNRIVGPSWVCDCSQCQDCRCVLQGQGLHAACCISLAPNPQPARCAHLHACPPPPHRSWIAAAAAGPPSCPAQPPAAGWQEQAAEQVRVRQRTQQRHACLMHCTS